MKNLTTLLALLFILVASSFSTIETPTMVANESANSIDLCVLDEELPHIYSMVDFNSFNVYDQKFENGEVTQVKAYDVKQNGNSIGIVGEIHGSTFYAENSEHSFTFYDLTHGTTFTAPKTYDDKAKTMTPDFEQTTFLEINGENPNPNPGEKGWCYAFCFAKYVACISAAGAVIYGGATAATAATGGPGAITFTVAGAAQAAAVALCLVNYNSCLEWCDS